MIRPVFIITSAVNTKFGVFSSQQRLEQTLATIASVKAQAPSARIFLLEMAGISLSPEQADTLSAQVESLLDFTKDPDVVGLYNSTDNWDVVKNVTEVMCFSKALKRLHSDAIKFENADRIFKLSGRYTLNGKFDLSWYDNYRVQEQIIVGSSRSSQFAFNITQVERQYMSRLWSWPTKLTDEIISVYDRTLAYMGERLSQGGYVDIEHALYKFLDPNKVTEKQEIGVEGNIGPNGVAVRD
jgi:hypothetical protein